MGCQSPSLMCLHHLQNILKETLSQSLYTTTSLSWTASGRVVTRTIASSSHYADILKHNITAAPLSTKYIVVDAIGCYCTGHVSHEDILDDDLYNMSATAMYCLTARTTRRDLKLWECQWRKALTPFDGEPVGPPFK